MDMTHIDSLLAESRKAWEVSDYDASEQRARQALDILTLESSSLDSAEAAQWWKMHTAYAYRLLGISLKDRGKFTQALECYQQSLHVSEECGDTINSVKTLMNIGVIHEKRGEYPQALECFHKAYEVKVQTDDHEGASKVLVNMAIVYRKLGKYAKALEYNSKALILKEQTGDQLGESHVLNNIGLLHYDEGNFDTALEYYSKALHLKEQLGERLGVSTVLTNIAAAYCKKSEYKEAVVYCNRALRLKEELGTSSGKSHVYEVLGRAYLQTGEVESAEKSLMQALCFAQESNTRRQEASVYKWLADLYRSTNEWDKCAYYLEQHYETEKAIINEPIARRIVELETHDTVKLAEFHYEIAKRDAEIEHIRNEELARALSTVQKLNQELAIRNAELQSLNEEKNMFLAMASHDMKNPLASVQMMAELLVHDASLSLAEVRQFASDIVSNSKRMYSLVSNLLDIHAIEEGKLRLQPTQVNTTELINACIKEYSLSAEKKNIHIEKTFPADVVHAYADTGALRQVVDNLLSNAIKYSPIGGRVSIQLLQQHQVLRISISDEGQGISKEEQALLFRKFQRLSARPTNGEHSTGLGLAITRQLTEAMKGRIWCESAKGTGSTFVIELPVSA